MPPYWGSATYSMLYGNDWMKVLSIWHKLHFAPDNLVYCIILVFPYYYGLPSRLM